MPNPRVARWQGRLITLILLTPGLAGAQDTVPDAHALAIAEGSIYYCGQHDAAATESLRQLVKRLVDGASEEQLSAVRSTYVYLTSYGSILEFTGKLDPHNAHRFCTEAVTRRR